MDNSAQRTLLLNVRSGSQVSVQDILEAIQVLEKQISDFARERFAGP